MEGVILEDEQTPDLQRDCKAEKERILKSRLDGQKHKDNLQLKLEPKPPTGRIASGCRVCGQPDWPSIQLARGCASA